jgi:hypothetical protein
VALKYFFFKNFYFIHMFINVWFISSPLGVDASCLLHDWLSIELVILAKLIVHLGISDCNKNGYPLLNTKAPTNFYTFDTLSQLDIQSKINNTHLWLNINTTLPFSITIILN